MPEPLIGGLVLAAVLTGSTRQGRATARKTAVVGLEALRNAVGSGYTETGWRRPGEAVVHHSGRGGAAAGRAFAATTRKTKDVAGRRWQERIDAGGGPGTHPPIRLLNKAPARRADQDSGSGPRPSTPPAPPSRPAQPRRPGHEPRGAAPGSTTPNPAPFGAGGNDQMARFAINLEPPTTDAEFLASCVDLGDALKAMAESIEEWAEGLAGLGLPSSVTTPLNAVSEGISDAAAGATRAANAFADEFEDAREVASRGMKFTGRDAA